MSAGCTVLHSGMAFSISASAGACILLHLMADANMRCLLRTWSSTLLQSSNEVFTYGISGAFWYAAGAVLQVIAQGHPLILFCSSSSSVYSCRPHPHVSQLLCALHGSLEVGLPTTTTHNHHTWCGTVERHRSLHLPMPSQSLKGTECLERMRGLILRLVAWESWLQTPTDPALSLACRSCCLVSWQWRSSGRRPGPTPCWSL